MSGAVMGLNAAGQNVGITIRTGLAGVGLGLGGYPALAALLAAISAVALGMFLAARRSLGTVTVHA